MEARATSNVFCRAEHGEFRKNQIRRKAWRLDPLEIEPLDIQASAKWRDRAKTYWRRQERLYGVKHSDFTLQYDAANRTVYTHSMVLAVLPGQRLPKRQYRLTEDFQRAMLGNAA